MYNNNTKNIRQKGIIWTMSEGDWSNRQRIVNNDISPNSYIKDSKLVRACQILTETLETY
jgi:hypothetical protein